MEGLIPSGDKVEAGVNEDGTTIEEPEKPRKPIREEPKQPEIKPREEPKEREEKPSN